ncbi:MAG: EpsG family protein [Bacillota bacterium]|nr:EpsG family protein [Bacillota bacterium]
MSNLISLLFYICVFTISALLISRSTKEHSSLYALLGISILIIVSGLRYGVGTDFFTYMKEFDRIKLISWQDVLSVKNLFNEFGFKLLMKSTSGYRDIKVFLGLITALTLVPLYIALKNQYSEINIGLAFYFFLFIYFPSSFNILRQYIAVAVTFYALKFVFDKNLYKYIICVFIAFLFHKSAFIALPIYFLWDKKSNSVIKGFKLAIVIIIFIFATYNYQTIISLISTNNVFENYAGFSISNTTGSNRDFYIHILIMLLILLISKRLMERDKRNGLFILMLVISVLINLTGFMHPQVKRISLYYELPLIVIIGYLPSLFKNDSKAGIKLLVIFYSIAYFILAYYLIRGGEIFPYKIQ